MPPTRRKNTRLARASSPDRSSRRGRSGRVAVAWRATKPPINASANRPPPTVTASAQPRSWAPTIVATASIRPAVTSTPPRASAPRRRPMPAWSGRTRWARTAAARPIGTLTKKTQCHDVAWVRRPPRTRPIDPPAAWEKLKAPIARACARGSEKVVTTIPSVTAEVRAAPTPCTNRATTRTTGAVASPHTSEATTNRARPAWNTRRRPTRSPSRPARSSIPPKATM